MSELTLIALKEQRLFCIKVLSKLMFNHDIKSSITFLIYFGQLVLVDNPLTRNDKYYVGAGVVKDMTKDNTLTSAINLRNSLVHYNRTLMNTCANILCKVDPEDYKTSNYYAYLCYIKEIDWKELKDFYNKI